MKYQIPKGVFDILPEDPDPKGLWRSSHLWNFLEGKIREQARAYGFEEIRTPLFEQTELFNRTIGETSDIVSKEMYTFHDKKGRSITLRPEGTAPVMRSFIEKHLDQQRPLHKLFYLFPMFRYERSQAGRYRQHHQFGVEAIGSNSPLQDVEVINLLYSLLSKLGLKNLHLTINSLGAPKTREVYRSRLQEYLRPHLGDLSEESERRFTTNPLRILDSKDKQDREILKEAPSILDDLDPKAQEHFESVCLLLKNLEIPFTIDPMLVRGLDYYNGVVFEVTAKELGAQNALGGGGRYDGLIQSLGGPPLPAIGFGAGLERILQTMIGQQVFLPSRPSPLLYLIPLGDAATTKSFLTTETLREMGLAVDLEIRGKKLSGAMRYADAIGAKFVAVIGEEEMKSNHLTLKEMKSGDTTSLSFETLAEFLQHV